MGMGYAGAYVDAIEWGEVVKLLPEATAAFTACLARYCQGNENPEIDWSTPELLLKALSQEESDLAEALAIEDEVKQEAAIAEIQNAYCNLQQAFRAATRVVSGLAVSSLELYVDYHNAEDDGDRYDEVRGVYWGVSNAYSLTPAGARFKHLFERRHFVQFG